MEEAEADEPPKPSYQSKLNTDRWARWIVADPCLEGLLLSILGRPPQEFDAYETAIRSEYAWVEESAFHRRRAEIVAAFLTRPKIFLTDELHARFEQPARENLERSLRRWRVG